MDFELYFLLLSFHTIWAPLQRGLGAGHEIRILPLILGGLIFAGGYIRKENYVIG